MKLGAFCQANVNFIWARAPNPINQSFGIITLSLPRWLLRGLDPIGFDRARCNLWSVACNHPFSLCNKEVVAQCIAHEESWLVQLHWRVHISPIGLVPKAHQPGRWQMIVDLSFPPGSSVNNGIDPSLSSICYASIDNLVDIIAAWVRRLFSQL